MISKTLFTIGYEGGIIDDFVWTLQRAGVETLIDVRDVPLSRKKGFSKTALSGHINQAGLAYLHLRGLGDPKPGREAARAGRYDDFHRIFCDHLRSEVARIDLARGVEVASSGFACLMCFERDHRSCHRCIVAEAMAAIGGFKIVHLGIQAPKTHLAPRPTMGSGYAGTIQFR